MYFCWIFS